MMNWFWQMYQSRSMGKEKSQQMLILLNVYQGKKEPHTHTKINARWTIDLKVKGKL